MKWRYLTERGDDVKIKFRVWDGTKMWYPDDESGYWGVSATGELFFSDSGDYDGPEGARDAIAMLSTGLTDRNGREIFEGDIILWKDPDFNPIIEAHRTLVILGCEYDFFHEMGEGLFCADSVAVIFNKFENPELMKG